MRVAILFFLLTYQLFAVPPPIKKEILANLEGDPKFEVVIPEKIGGLRVRARITATGTWSTDRGQGSYGPFGQVGNPIVGGQNHPMKGKRQGALVMIERANGKERVRRCFEPPNDFLEVTGPCELAFVINDDQRGDNSGELIVTVEFDYTE